MQPCQSTILQQKQQQEFPVAQQVKALASSLQRIELLPVVRVLSLTWEFPHAADMEKKKKKKAQQQELNKNLGLNLIYML